MWRVLGAVLLTFIVFVRHGGAAERLPNELGRVPILEYHRIDRPEARWTRTPEHFREDLERLWQSGYRLIALTDLLQGRIAIPAGASPVVLTFDDSSPGQFRLVADRGQLAPAPDCALGILERFEREHPGFGHAATFYVLPGADPPNRLFNQPELIVQKLRYLATHGYEIGNHTLWHAQLNRYPEPMVRRQLALAQREIERLVPGYRLRTLALPLGAYPTDPAWAISGAFEGTKYRHEAILEVSGGSARSPYDAAFNPYRLPRIQAIESEMRIWMMDFDRHPERRFVSDGDPSTITVGRGQRQLVAAEFAARVRER